MKPTTVTILACYQKKVETERCIKSLRKHLPEGEHYLILIDDDCPEQSAQAGAAQWDGPSEILSTNGEAFWTESMRIGERRAKELNPDFILWINQDTEATQNLSPLFCEDAIISATCLNPANHPYKGPLVREKPCGFRLAWPGDKPQTFNGNLVVIPQKAWKQLEIKSYRHAFGDLHYGLDAHQKGIPILKGPECARTSWQNPNWRDQKTFAKRLRHCLHPTGLPPSDWWKFCRHFGGPAYPLRFLVGYRYLLHKRSSPHPMVKTEPPHP